MNTHWKPWIRRFLTTQYLRVHLQPGIFEYSSLNRLFPRENIATVLNIDTEYELFLKQYYADTIDKAYSEIPDKGKRLLLEKDHLAKRLFELSDVVTYLTRTHELLEQDGLVKKRPLVTTYLQNAMYGI